METTYNSIAGRRRMLKKDVTLRGIIVDLYPRGGYFHGTDRRWYIQNKTYDLRRFKTILHCES